MEKIEQVQYIYIYMREVLPTLVSGLKLRLGTGLDPLSFSTAIFKDKTDVRPATSEFDCWYSLRLGVM